MIIEIALGIILAILVLAFLPYIIAAGFLAIAIGLVAAIAIIAFASPRVAIYVAVIVAALGLNWYLGERDKRAANQARQSRSEDEEQKSDGKAESKWWSFFLAFVVYGAAIAIVGELVKLFK